MRSTAPVQIPDRISGYRSRVINGILDYLESLRPIDTRTVRHVWRSDGTETHATTGGGAYVPYRRLWDIIGAGDDWLKLYLCPQINYAGACVGGAYIATGYEAGIGIDEHLTMTDSSVLRAAYYGATATLKIGVTACGSGTGLEVPADANWIWPLWYVPWVTPDGGGDKVMGVPIDLRDMLQLPKMV